ncbi:sensor histidine kinase [Cohnella caldifontis]|uniref:sensor histidine kinase n=1 Tax=Cohnella caldifontis TaxID=3027471 RepID=UPI0023ED717A|nr:HAMP domain-containing sensor histidine kinase [Cohnella sp. YIM B05605]
MKNDPLSVLKSLSGWRALRGVLEAAVLAALTLTLLFPALTFAYERWVTVRGFVLLLVSGSMDGNTLLTLLYLAFFGFYLYRFYVRESYRYTELRIRQIMGEVEAIAAGDLSRQVSVRDRGELGQLAAHINNIVVQAKRAMEEERRSEQIKNELITNVSHDLRTPLTSIVGYLNLINTDRYRDEVELRYYTQVLHQKTERLHGLINDLFEYTRMQNRGMVLQKERVDLAEMLDQLAVQFQPQFDEAGMECRQAFEVLHPIVPADGNKLVRVFENLIQNAVTYGQEGKFADLRLREEGETIVAEIVNYGAMIPSTDLPHLFDRFYRVEKSRSDYTGGSGLGLAIAKSIVDLHGGRIEAESSPERTLFRVTLPK